MVCSSSRVFVDWADACSFVSLCSDSPAVRMGWSKVSSACVFGVVLWFCLWGRIMCRCLAWFVVTGFRAVICPLTSAISITQDPFVVLHVRGSFVVVMVGSASSKYWFVLHKYNTPFARGSHVVVFASSN